MRQLTAKQSRFVEEYPVDLNATQAAIRSGYSAKTAYSAGQRLLKHVDVIHELEIARKMRSERTELSADMTVREIGKIAFSTEIPIPHRLRALEMLGRHQGIFVDRSALRQSQLKQIDVPPASATYEEWLEQRIGHVETNAVRRADSADVVEIGCEAV